MLESCLQADRQMAADKNIELGRLPFADVGLPNEDAFGTADAKSVQMLMMLGERFGFVIRRDREFVDESDEHTKSFEKVSEPGV